MPFLDDIDVLGSKAPIGRLPRPVLAGIAIVAAAIVVLAALGVASTARGDFVVGNSTSSSLAAISETGDTGELRATGKGSLGAGGASEHAEEDASAPRSCYVYVVGAVKHPGVYEVPSDARVTVAVDLAGGMTKKADASAVNLARTIVDGEQITIPERGESVPTAGASTNAPAGSAAAGASEVGMGKVNLNTADAAELQTLPGIGEVTAAKIIASREAEGPFASTEDLKRVSGIGDKKYAAVADLITV